MGGWPLRITYGQMIGHCSFDSTGCELQFRAGDREALLFHELHKIRVVDYADRGGFVDLHPKRRGRLYRVWVHGDERSRESRAFMKYMSLLEEQGVAQQER